MKSPCITPDTKSVFPTIPDQKVHKIDLTGREPSSQIHFPLLSQITSSYNPFENQFHSTTPIGSLFVHYKISTVGTTWSPRPRLVINGALNLLVTASYLPAKARSSKHISKKRKWALIFTYSQSGLVAKQIQASS